MDHSFEHPRTNRNRFTRMCIGEALLSLLKQKDFSEVRVSDIVSRAGISRMTYYNYYHSKNDVLCDYLQEIIHDYILETKTKKDIGTFHEYAHILHCLHFFDHYADFFLTLVHADLYSIIINAINDYMVTQIFPSYQGSIYELYYYSGALLNTFIRWIDTGKQESAETMAEIIASFLH